MTQSSRRYRHPSLGLRRQIDGGLEGLYVSAIRGEGSAFEELREYVPGDDVRLIDWNVTARMQQPHIKVFRQERRVRLLMLLDQSASMAEGRGEQSKFSTVMALMGALAAVAVEQGDEVAALASHSMTMLRPTRNAAAVENFIGTCPLPALDSGRTVLSVLTERASPLINRQTLIVVLSDLGFGAGPAGEVPLMRQFLRRQEWVAIVPHGLGAPEVSPGSPSPWRGLWSGSDAETGEGGVLVFGRPAGASPAAEWRSVLLRHGHDVVDVPCEADPMPALVRWLRQRARTPRRLRGTH